MPRCVAWSWHDEVDPDPARGGAGGDRRSDSGTERRHRPQRSRPAAGRGVARSPARQPASTTDVVLTSTSRGGRDREDPGTRARRSGGGAALRLLRAPSGRGGRDVVGRVPHGLQRRTERDARRAVLTRRRVVTRPRGTSGPGARRRGRPLPGRTRGDRLPRRLHQRDLSPVARRPDHRARVASCSRPRTRRSPSGPRATSAPVSGDSIATTTPRISKRWVSERVP